MSGYPSAPGFAPPPYPVSRDSMAMPMPGDMGGISMPMPMPMPGSVGNMPMPEGTGPKLGLSPAPITSQPPYNPAFLPPKAEGQGGGYPPTGYPSTGPVYPPSGPGYPPSGGAGYPPSSGPGYPPSGDAGYPPSSGPGYPPSGGAGYPPSGGPGYPPSGGPGYPPSGGAGYPPSSGPGYPPSSGPGFPPSGPAGYPPGNPYGPAGGDSAYPTTQPGYYPPAAPISSQPTGHGAPDGGPGGWMSVPQSRPVNCPPGLEYLATLDQLLVHQKVEILEALIGFETENKYDVKNSMGQKIYKAKEKSSCCVRCCCGSNRPFDMKIMDNFQNEVIHLKRPFAFQSCLCPCWLQSMEVYAPPGNFIGSVEQDWSICSPQFSIKNAAGDTILRIEGPFCTYSICGDVEFKVLALNGETVVGNIRKQWSGLLREAFTDADHFGVTFPMDLDVKMKAVMLGACFLIDAMFFEKKGNKEEDRPGMF